MFNEEASSILTQAHESTLTNADGKVVFKSLNSTLLLVKKILFLILSENESAG